MIIILIEDEMLLCYTDVSLINNQTCAD